MMPLEKITGEAEFLRAVEYRASGVPGCFQLSERRFLVDEEALDDPLIDLERERR